MKKSKLFVIVLVIILGISSFSFASSEPVVTSLANEGVPLTENQNSVETSNTTTVTTEDTNNDNSNNILNSDMYSCCQSFSTNKAVDGNAFICAIDVTINNVINGNTFICGKDVTIDSATYIYGDVYVCAENLTIKGGAISDLYAFCKKFTLSPNAYIARDLKIYTQDATFEGLVGRDAAIFAKNLNVNTSTAKIGNNLSYSSSNLVVGLENIVGGTIDYSEINDNSSMTPAEIAIQKQKQILKYVKNIFFDLIFVLAIALILVFGIKTLPNKFATTLKENPFVTFLYGFVGLIAIVFVSILLMITIVGIPLGILALALLALSMIFSKVIAIVGLSKLMANNNKKGNGYVILFVAILTIGLWILSNIPIVGGLASFIVNMYGLGIVIYLLMHINKTQKSEVATVQKSENNTKDKSDKLLVADSKEEGNNISKDNKNSEEKIKNSEDDKKSNEKVKNSKDDKKSDDKKSE